MANEKFNEKSFNAEAFGRYVDRVPNLKRNELIKSQALRGNSQIRSLFSSQTTTHYGRIPLFGNLDGEPVNFDGKTDITADSTTTYEQGVVVFGRAKGWTEMDFSEDITGGVKFMDNVARQVSEYWSGIDQGVLLSILKGIFSMTGANNLEFVNGHTYDITDATGEDTQGNPKCNVGPATLNTAIQQASGQDKNKFKIVIMHSAVATNLENMKLVKYMTYTDKDGVERDLQMGTWNGRIVIIDDSMPTEEVAGTGENAESYTKYTSYVLGQGAFSYENIGARHPYAMVRDEKTNGGMTTLYSRQRKCIAPVGISYEKKSQASLSPTNAEFENGANWTLVNDNGTGGARKYYDHKAIPICRIFSRG